MQERRRDFTELSQRVLEGRAAMGGIAQPTGEEAEPDHHEQPAVEVPGRDAEPALLRTDVAPRPQAHPNRHRVEGQVEGDGEQAVDDLSEIAGLDAERAAKLIMAARAHWFEQEQQAKNG